MSDHEIFVKEQLNRLPNVETSHRCPLRCPQCTRAKLQRPKDTKGYREIKERIVNGFDLPLHDAKKILNFFNDGVMLCGSISDPVYWPYLYDFLEFSSKYPQKKIQIHTSANQKNLDWYKKAFSLSHSNVYWKFGLDGLPDTSPIYRIGQDSDLIFSAMRLGSSMNINVSWQFIVFEHNKNQIDQAREIAKSHGIELHLIKTDRTGGGMEVPVEWRPARTKEIVYDII